MEAVREKTPVRDGAESNERRSQRRADLQIYRPGALRHQTRQQQKFPDAPAKPNKSANLRSNDLIADEPSTKPHMGLAPNRVSDSVSTYDNEMPVPDASTGNRKDVSSKKLGEQGGHLKSNKHAVLPDEFNRRKKGSDLRVKTSKSNISNCVDSSDECLRSERIACITKASKRGRSGRNKNISESNVRNVTSSSSVAQYKGRPYGGKVGLPIFVENSTPNTSKSSSNLNDPYADDNHTACVSKRVEKSAGHVLDNSQIDNISDEFSKMSSSVRKKSVTKTSTDHYNTSILAEHQSLPDCSSVERILPNTPGDSNKQNKPQNVIHEPTTGLGSTDDCQVTPAEKCNKGIYNSHLKSNRGVSDVAESTVPSSVYTNRTVRNSPPAQVEWMKIGRGRGRGRRFQEEENGSKKKSVVALKAKVETNTNATAIKDYCQQKGCAGREYDKSNMDDRLYRPNRINKSRVNDTYKQTSSGPPVPKTGKKYHVDAKVVEENSSLLIAPHKLEIQEELGEEIKPMVFINPSDDEEQQQEANGSTGSSSWAEQSWRQTQREKQQQLAQPPAPKAALGHEKQQQHQHQHLEYEQNLTQFLKLSQQQHQPEGGSTFEQYGLSVDRGRADQYVAPPPLLITKQLYNPADPSKPLLVPVMARDLPRPPPSYPNTTSELDEFAVSAADLAAAAADAGPLGGYEELLHNIQKGECDIQYYVNSNQIPREFPRIMDIRVYLQTCYTKLFASNIALCHQKNIEAQMWKTLYYNIIEKLRDYIQRSPELREKSVSTLLMLVQEGHKFLQGLVRSLESSHGLRVGRVVRSVAGDGEEYRGRAKMALGVVQRLLLDLGDLARYRYHYAPATRGQLSLPYRWYNLASRLYPRNGRPFHQLAILSVSQKRPLDVFYYYVRSLQAANPFMSAKDSLTAFFDGIRKKFELLDREVRAAEPPLPDQTPSLPLGVHSNSAAVHREVWVRLDSVTTTQRSTFSKCDYDAVREEDPVEKLQKTLQPDQLMKQFLTWFLHCHGLLFSRVSLEVFPGCCRRTLLLYAALLRTQPPRLSATHLTQLHALNMFAVHSTQLHDTSLGQGYRSAAQELALLLAQEMFGRLAQHIASILPQNINTRRTTTSCSSGSRQGGDSHGGYGDTSLHEDYAGDINSNTASNAPSLGEPQRDTHSPGTWTESKQDTRTSSALGAADACSPPPPPPPPSDPFDVVEMTWLLDEVEQQSVDQVVQLPRLLLPRVAHFVPALKVWCDWLLYNSSTWHPPAHSADYCTPGYECWASVAELATILHGLGSPDVPLLPASPTTAATAAGGEAAAAAGRLLPLVLEEDRFLKGYDPLLKPQQMPPMFTTDPAAVSRGCDWVRVQQLQTVLSKFLCGLEPPVLQLHKTLQGEVLLPVPSTPADSPTPPENNSSHQHGEEERRQQQLGEEESTCSSSSDCEELEEPEEEGEDQDPIAAQMAATLRMLWRRKRELDREKRRVEREKRRDNCHVTVELEVRPRYVVADTNCFISHLDYLRALVQPPSPYSLMVPLLVVSELDGLSRGVRGAPSAVDGSLGEVVGGLTRPEMARLAREFVRSRSHNIKIVTTNGVFVSSSDYQESVDDQDDRSNDDRILSCCTHFCRTDTSSSGNAAPDCVQRVVCDVVLLTADRNMLIKAYAANVPVRSVHDFRRWAAGGSNAAAPHHLGRSSSAARGGRGRGSSDAARGRAAGISARPVSVSAERDPARGYSPHSLGATARGYQHHHVQDDGRDLEAKRNERSSARQDQHHRTGCEEEKPIRDRGPVNDWPPVERGPMVASSTEGGRGGSSQPQSTAKRRARGRQTIKR